VLDNNLNVTRVVTGPCTYTRQDHEKVVSGPEEMLQIPPRHYCVITNPCVRDEKGEIVLDKHQQIKLRHGDMEVRLEQEPFPLYPGEVLAKPVQPLRVVGVNTALRLQAVRDCTDLTGTKRQAGDEWLFKGPATYIPSVEVTEVETIASTIIKANEAIRLKARNSFKSRDGVERKAGEEWLFRDEGAFLPDVDEIIVGKVKAHVLTEKAALHMRGARTFTDVFGKVRKAGEEWLVTVDDADTYIPDIHEEVVSKTDIITLSNRQYCIVLNPVVDGKQQLGSRALRKGECSFYLFPGEELEAGIQDVYVLGQEEALLLKATEAFDDDGKKRQPGDVWMTYGPRDYVPPVQVQVVETRRAIALDENEGIYIRNVRTGKVRAQIGSTYMLEPEEELWEKDLPPEVEELLDTNVSVDRTVEARMAAQGRTRTRDRTKVVTYRVPHNAAVQIYDYRERKARVSFGPELVTLGPDEHFTILSLSGGKPKEPNQIRSVGLLLGPDFMTDVVVVETSDHARLQLKLSYNWHFEVDPTNPIDAAKVFQVPDFVGDACKAIASRVRGAVAGSTFDNFHKNSARLIRVSVFGEDEEGRVKGEFRFKSNNLVITNVDIQSVEPVDQRTRDALQRSVQMAIEITTKSQEASAKHEAERQEQEARGRLERQKILDESEAENARKSLLELQALSAAVESMGQAKAEAQARSEALVIEGQSAVKQAELKAEALKIESQQEIELLRLRQEQEVDHVAKMNELELAKASKLNEIEAKKFKETVDAIGADTIKAMAQAGPEMQAKLLQGLGLQGYLITDGSTPVNLFNTAKGMLGAAPGGCGSPAALV
jgi:major vault protein